MCVRPSRNEWRRRWARARRSYRRFTACWPSVRNWRSGLPWRSRRGGEPERELDPAVRRTTDRRRPAVQPHDRLHDRQPQAARFRELAAGCIAAIEPVEQAREVVGCDRPALIADHDNCTPRVLCVLAAGQPDRGAGFGIAHCVDYHVADCALRHDRVSEHLAFSLYLETEIAFVGESFKVRRDSFQLLANVQRRALYILLL